MFLFVVFVFALTLVPLPCRSQNVIPFQDLVGEKFERSSPELKYGLEDTNTGFIVLQPKYQAIYKDYKAIVAKDNFGRYGMLDQKGQVVLDFTGQSIHEVAPDTVIIQKTFEARIVNSLNEPILDGVYLSIQYIDNKFFRCQDLNEKYGLLDLNGNELIPFKYDYLRVFHDEGFALVRNGRTTWSTINLKGEVIATLAKEIRAGETSCSSDALRIKIHGRFNEYELYDLPSLNQIGDSYNGGLMFSEGICAVRKGDRMGCIDISGKTVVPFIWELIHERKDGLIPVGNIEKKSGVINLDGDTIVPIIFSAIDIRNGFIRMSYKETSCLANLQGEIIAPCGNDHILTYKHNKAIVVYDSFGTLMDTSGTEMLHLHPFNLVEYIPDGNLL